MLPSLNRTFMELKHHRPRGPIQRHEDGLNRTFMELKQFNIINSRSS